MPFFVCLLLAFLVRSPASADTIKVAGFSDYAPYSGENLPGHGFANDLLVKALGRAGHSVTVAIYPWARALRSVTDGAADVIPSIWMTEKRKEELAFTDPFTFNRIVFVKKKNDPFEYNSLSDLKGKVIGTIIDYAYSQDFIDAKDFEKKSVKSITQNITLVANDRIDLTLDDELILKMTINDMPQKIRDAVALTKGALVETPAYMAFSRKNPNAEKYVADFNKALASMKEDGSYDALLAAHHLK